MARLTKARGELKRRKPQSLGSSRWCCRDNRIHAVIGAPTLGQVDRAWTTDRMISLPSIVERAQPPDIGTGSFKRV